ncbi:MAG: uracil-DNA glycosylase [Lachnospiraceae bacterium]|nr:uracil-DNA glycosylase [Lachnospiraceae bacterium]
MFEINKEWEEVLKEEFAKDYYKELMDFVMEEYDNTQVFPPRECVFSAFEYTPLSKVKCVILGQDPYHNDGQAHGLAFSVNKDIAIPPSLVNIYKELESDEGITIPDNGYLVSWAKQGVLLLNTVFTVRAHEPNSHKNKGWEKFTDAIIDVLNKQDRPIVYLLWGKPAQTKIKRLNNPKHLILTAPHPSPLSSYRGFFGCKHFSKANEFLTSNNIDRINWQI